MNKELLEEIRHELTCITGLNATDTILPKTGYVSLNVDDLFELNYTNLIEKIDKELKE